MLRSNSKSLGMMYSVLKKKKKGCSGKDLQKRKVLSLEWKREWVIFIYRETVTIQRNTAINKHRYKQNESNDQVYQKLT